MYKTLYTALIALAASGISLLSAVPSQAQIQITGGNIGGSLKFDLTNPAIAFYTLRTVTVNSLTLDLAGGGSIRNFEGAATLTGANVQNALPNGLARIGTSGSFSGVVTGRSLLTTGQFLAFSNTPINLQAVVTSGTTSFAGTEATQVGTLNVLGGSIQSNANLTSGSVGNAFISNNGATAVEVANNPEIQARIANNPKYVRVGSTGIGVIQGPPSRVFPMQ